jgi:hypothetical protein
MAFIRTRWPFLSRPQVLRAGAVHNVLGSAEHQTPTRVCSSALLRQALTRSVSTRHGAVLRPRTALLISNPQTLANMEP